MVVPMYDHERVGADPDVLLQGGDPDRPPWPGRQWLVRWGRWVAGGAAVALAVALVLINHARASHDVPTANQSTAPATRPAPSGFRLTDWLVSGMITMTNANVGYTIGADCAISRPGYCTLQLLATLDGGRNWRPRGVPLAGIRGGGAATLVSDPASGLGAFDLFDQSQRPIYRTTDLGRHWLPITARPARTPEVPGGTRRLYTPSGLDGPQVIDLVNGTVAPLAGAPSLHADDVYTDDHGNTWLSGVDDHDHALLAVPRGDGSWRTVALPGGLTYNSVQVGDVTDTRIAVLGQPAEPGSMLEHQRTTLWTSTDAGLSWRETGISGPPADIAQARWVGDRLLVLDQADVTWWSTDGGHTFSRIGAEMPSLTRTQRVNGQLYAWYAPGYQLGWFVWFDANGAPHGFIPR
jgi:hypothetical protein